MLPINPLLHGFYGVSTSYFRGRDSEAFTISPAGPFFPHQYLPRWRAWHSLGHTTSRQHRHWGATWWSRKTPSLNEEICLELEPISTIMFFWALGGWMNKNNHLLHDLQTYGFQRLSGRILGHMEPSEPYFSLKFPIWIDLIKRNRPPLQF